MLPVPAPLAFRPARAVLHDGRQYRSVLSIRQIYLFHCIDSQTWSGKKKGAPDRQNRCALTVAAVAASPPPQQGDQCLTPIYVPFGDEDITPFTSEFLARDLGQTLRGPSGLTLKGPGWGRKMGPESTPPPSQASFRPGGASALRQVRPTRFSITRASARNRMDGMLTASQGGQVLMRPRLEKRPFMM